jgi:hypothetical protein
MSSSTPAEKPDRNAWRELAWWERRVAFAKNCVEIVAIVVAAIWAYKRFIETEKPA